jgi:hypothetical protein
MLQSLLEASALIDQLEKLTPNGYYISFEEGKYFINREGCRLLKVLPNGYWEKCGPHGPWGPSHFGKTDSAEQSLKQLLRKLR